METPGISVMSFINRLSIELFKLKILSPKTSFIYRIHFNERCFVKDLCLELDNVN